MIPYKNDVMKDLFCKCQGRSLRVLENILFLGEGGEQGVRFQITVTKLFLN